MRPHIAHWIWGLELGGDAKNLCSLALAQQAWADVSVLTKSAPSGVRAPDLEAQGIRVLPGMDCADGLTAWIGESPPWLVIIHRNGRNESIETSLLASLRSSGIPCFEYNTFARFDPATAGLWTGHLHLSRTSMMQYAKRKGVSPLNMPGHAAIGYAVDVPNTITWEERSSARQTLGIDQKAFVVLRLLRPDLRKWDPLPVLAVHRLMQENLPVHLVVRSVPKVRERWVQQNCGSSLTLLEPTDMAPDLRLTLAAADCLVNCSQIGETFGLGLAEAMAVGLPVIVNATPQMDNAQIELCLHESNGLVANTVSALTNALRYLFERPDYAVDLGREGRRFIGSTFATPVVERRVRKFLIERLKAGGTNLAEGIPTVDRQDVVYKLDQQWLNEYRERLSQEYRPSQSLLKEAIDLQALNWLRLSDNVAYALDIGPRAIVQSVIRRIKSGSLSRE